MTLKPFDKEVARLGDYVLTWTAYDDADGFVKNWYEIFREIGGDYISIRTVPGFTYTSVGVKDYFTNFVCNAHSRNTENTI